MAYIGNPPADRYSAVSYQDLTGGTGTSFTLDYAVGSANEIEVFVNNVRQEPSVAYTVAGTALTMTGTIASTDDFYVVFQGKAQQTVTHPATHALEATDGTFSGDISAVAGAFTGNVDINGNDLILDSDADTKLYASTDDIVKMNIAGSEMFRFDSDGIKFNGDTASANAIYDYEFGTWTPAVSAGSITTANGHYIKVGGKVWVGFSLSGVSDITSTTQFQINNLPFAPTANANNAGAGAVFSRYMNPPPNATYVATNLYFYINGSAGQYAASKHQHFNSSSAAVFGEATYYTTS